MYVHWNEPLEILSNGIFIYADITEATLHVPYGTKALYESADVWRYFGKIVDDTSALNSIAVCEEETPVFNLVGMRQYPSCQTPGVYVMRGKKMIVR